MNINKLIGARITAVRPMSAKELEEMGWHDSDSTAIEIQIELADKTTAVLWPQRDEEGNGPGCLMVGTVEKCGGLFIKDGKVVIL